MPYTPQTGIGATLTVGSPAVTMHVVEMSCAFEREAIESSLLIDKYKTFTPGRLSGRISATLAVDGLVADAVLLGFQGQVALGTAAPVVYTDAGATNVYTGNAYIVSATHTSNGTDRDTLQVELQFSGSVA